jgi:hypothetical protein
MLNEERGGELILARKVDRNRFRLFLESEEEYRWRS